MSSDLVIREVKQGVWTFSRPFLRSGFIPFGGRSVAVKLQDNSVWLFASTKADEETLGKIREIGPVKYIIAPDYEHYLNLKDFHKAFPEAKVIGVDGLEKKEVLSDVKFSGLYGKDPEGTKYGFEDEISACYFSGFINKDVAFCHKSSKTLIQADLLLNLPANEQYSKSNLSATTWVPFVNNMNPWSRAHKFLIARTVSNPEVTKRHAQTVDSWDFDTIIGCHGDVIEGNGKAAWKSLWDKFLH